MLKVISNIAMAIGMIIAVLFACCIDSPGVYGYAAGFAYVAGLIIAGSGYIVRLVGERRKEKWTSCFHEVRRSDGLKADIEFINLEEVIEDVGDESFNGNV